MWLTLDQNIILHLFKYFVFLLGSWQVQILHINWLVATIQCVHLYFGHLFLAITFEFLIAQRTALNGLNLTEYVFFSFNSHAVPNVVFELGQFRFFIQNLLLFFGKNDSFVIHFWPILTFFWESNLTYFIK